jgi:hypothetical protein
MAVVLATKQEVVEGATADTSQMLPDMVWETKETPDGRKYYINHNSQTTSWDHPITGVTSPAALPTSE